MHIDSSDGSSVAGRLHDTRTPYSRDELSGVGIPRFGQTRLDAPANHVQGARSHAFDVLGKVERLGKQWISRDRRMGLAQLVERQRWWQSTGVPYLEAVGEEHHLDATVARVVSMRNSVNDRLPYDFHRNLVAHRSLDALRPRAHRECDLAQHEVHRLIDQLERRALVDVIGRNRFVDLGPVEVGALDLRRHQKSLRRLAEQQYRRICRTPVVQQLQVFQQLVGIRTFWQRETSVLAHGSDESSHPLRVKVGQCCT